MVMLIWCNKA